MLEPACRVDTVRRDEAAIVTLTGEIDMANVADVEATITHAVHEQATRVLVVDLGELRYLDSAALAALGRIGRIHATRIVLPKSAPTYRAVTVSGIQHSIPVLETVDEALR